MNHRGLEKTKTAAGKLTDDVAMSCSRLPSLLGFNGKWSSPNEELQKSIDALDPAYVRPVINNDAIHFGNVTEQVNLEYCAKKLNLSYLKVGITEPVIHKTDNLQGSLDGVANSSGQRLYTDRDKGIICLDADNKIVESLFIEGPGILEAKLTSAYPKDIPDPARGPIQIQGLMMCTGYTWGAVATLYQGIHHYVYVYESNKNIQSVISNEIKEFDLKINTYKEEGIVDWYPLFSPNEGAAVYSVDQGLPSVKLSKADEDNIEKYLDAKKAVSVANKMKDSACKAIMDTLGSHQSGVGEYYKVDWPMTNGRKGYVVQDSKPSRSKSLKIKEINK